jgi:putative spermidine/putrescine transport system substrate-binding protein
MVTINFLISPEAQLQKMRPDVWGDHTVLNVSDLPNSGLFKDIPGRRYAPDRSEIQAYAIQEPAAEYMIRLFEDFRENIIEQ